LAIIVICFTLIQFAPGDPTDVFTGEDIDISEELLAKLHEEWGLDKPFHEQLFIYVANIFSGNLGYSFHRRLPVIQLILTRLPNTLMILGALVLGAGGGIFLGVLSSRKPNATLDNAVRITSLVLHTTPMFWLALIFLIVFSVILNIFPTGGMRDLRIEPTGLSGLLDLLSHLALPVIVLALKMSSTFIRMTRTEMVDVLREDYIITARAKGLDERTVLFKHALRNAILPVITIIALAFGAILTGSVMLEIVFSWPGLGRLMFDAIAAKDYPVMLGMFIWVSMTMILVNLLADILYAVVDPRIRY
jgi:peptide/nickel transport system permease protein